MYFYFMVIYFKRGVCSTWNILIVEKKMVLA